MSIYETAYDTLIGSNIINTNKLTKEMSKYIGDDFVSINHAGLISDLPIIPIGLMGNCHAALKMPFFTNPLYIQNKDSYLVMDFRPFTVPTGNGCSFHDVRIRANTEYNLALDRLVLGLEWLIRTKDEKKENLTNFKLNFSYASFIFTKWISKLMTQRFNLYPDEAHLIEIIASYYYQSLFEKPSNLDHHTKEKLAIHTIKNTNAKAELVDKIFNDITEMSGLEDFCSTIVRVLENVKLENFTPAVLVTMVGNSWFGLNSKELLGIALEYPPTFIALVYNAIKEKTFKHTYIADITAQYTKKTDVSTFLMNYKSLIDSYTDASMMTKNL